MSHQMVSLNTQHFGILQEEDEVPDDETVNQMIARHEEEFDLFMVRMLLVCPTGQLYFPGFRFILRNS